LHLRFNAVAKKSSAAAKNDAVAKKIFVLA
jgi:hypothetical protein